MFVEPVTPLALRLPPEVIARGRQAARDIQAIEAAAGVPMLTVMSRFDAVNMALDALEFTRLSAIQEGRL